MLNRFIGRNDFLLFHEKMRAMYSSCSLSHTMVGFNFDEAEVASVKFYYVFRDVERMIENFPISGLSEQFRALILERSRKHFSVAITPGGWLTLTVKYSAVMEPSYGFFFRVDGDNEILVNNIRELHPSLNLDSNDFESGFGKYFMIEGGEVKSSDYLYIEKTSRCLPLAKEYNIDFLAASSVEVSASNSPVRDQKFIAVAQKNLAGPKFMGRIPYEIYDFLKGAPFHFLCPAVMPTKLYFSIYATSPWDKGIINRSIIDDLVKGAAL